MLQEYFSIKKKKTSEEIIIISFTQQFKNQMRLHAWFKWSAQSLIIQFGFLNFDICLYSGKVNILERYSVN